MRLLTVLVALVTTNLCQGELLINGDFESPRQDGWNYQGENDGSHGVFSEPSRPGTLTYLLQLAGSGKLGFSAISQKFAVTPGQTYRLSLEVFDGVPVSSNADLRHSAYLDGQLVFEKKPRLGHPVTGWYRRQATFRAQRSEAEILIKLNGVAGREESTTLIDNVRVLPIEREVPAPLLRGKPLRFPESSDRLAVAIGYAKPGGGMYGGFEPLERHLDFTGHYPPLCVIRGDWDLVRKDLESFSKMIPAIQPWVRSGVVPIINVHSSLAKVRDISSRKHDDFFRAWARQARNWGYPLVLRPWAGMDHEPDLNSGEFVSAWKHVHEIFAAQDARNVLWYWTPRELNGESRRFFPGISQVDLVGCDGLEPTAIYAEHLKHTGRTPFAFSGDFALDALPVWLANKPEDVVANFPSAQFYTHPHLEMVETWPKAAEAYAHLMAGSTSIKRLDQATPPELGVEVSRKGEAAMVAIENKGGQHALRQSRLKVQFWSANPTIPAMNAQEVGKARWITLRQGEKRVLRQNWADQGTSPVFATIDRSTDSTFLSGVTDDGDTLVFHES
tara:strand:+ start:18817 stop:20493 length:1677 start_codon:yes stop_codon:yes gene_type:complete